MQNPYRVPELLLIAFLALATGSFAIAAGPNQAKARPGFGYGAYIGMTMSEVSAQYRETQHARGWKVTTLLRGKGHTSQMVFWFYSDAPKNFRSFLFQDGHVISVSEYVLDPSGDNFKVMESIFNRVLVAYNDHHWFDKLSQTEWDLSSEDGMCALTVYKKGALKQ